jgi:YHS domain-containing protein
VVKEFGGDTYYFCSEHCLHAFEAGSPQLHRHDHESEAAHAH